MNADWLLPAWPAPPTVRAVCTTRAGGRSVGPYASLNLGDHVGDDPRSVDSNRTILAQALQARPVFLQQVHGRGVAHLDVATPDGTEADACLTHERGVGCTIMVADCLPVLLSGEAGDWVGAAHAGWRGLAGDQGVGVLEALAAAVAPSYGGMRGDGALAWLGPCIGPRAFEVGEEVKAAFEQHDARASAAFRPGAAAGKWLANLPLLARQRLQALGITRIYGNDGSDAWCTVTNPSRFFSYRRDGVCGRMAASVWLA